MFFPFEGYVNMFAFIMFILYNKKMFVFAMILYLAVQLINVQYNTIQFSCRHSCIFSEIKQNHTYVSHIQ